MDLTPSQQTENIPMPACRFANVSFIDILLNGHSTTLLFDTGAGKTALTRSAAVAAGAEMQQSSVQAGNHGGQIMTLQTAVVEGVSVGALPVPDLEVIIVPDEDFNFGLDEDGNSFPAAGFLGWDVISLFRWEVDPVERSYRISMERQASLQNLHWDAYAILKAEWEGDEVFLGFDSGHTETMLDHTWLERLPGLGYRQDSITGVGGTSEEEVAVVPEITFQIASRIAGRIAGKNTTLRDVPVLQHAVHGARDARMSALLGSDIVQGRRWVIDYPNRSFEIT